ncbi:RNA polymerase sigma factor [Chloroflexota bacterium]
MDKQSKEAKLSQLFEDHFDQIMRYVASRVSNFADAEDLAGEVFVKATVSIDKYKERGAPIQAWLFKIAHNLVIDYQRRKGKIQFVPIEGMQTADSQDVARIAEGMVEYEKVVKVLDKLTDDQRRVIELRFLGELTSEETAKVMGKKSGTVRQVQSIALQKIRQLLKQDERTKDMSDV